MIPELPGWRLGCQVNPDHPGLDDYNCPIKQAFMNCPGIVLIVSDRGALRRLPGALRRFQSGLRPHRWDGLRSVVWMQAWKFSPVPLWYQNGSVRASLSARPADWRPKDLLCLELHGRPLCLWVPAPLPGANPPAANQISGRSAESGYCPCMLPPAGETGREPMRRGPRPRICRRTRRG